MISIQRGIPISFTQWSKKIYGFIRFIRPEIIILGIVCVYIGALAGGSKFFSIDLLLGMLAIFFISAGCHPLNDYFDYEIDKVNHPKRPLPSGVFKPLSGLYMGIILLVISLILSLLINIYCFAINCIGIVLILLYELYLKNKGIFGNILVAFSVSLTFLYGGAIVFNYLKPLFFSFVAFFIFFGREIIMDVRDFEGDKKTRITLPSILGKKWTIYLGSAMVVTSLVLLFLPFFNESYNIWYGLITIFLVLFTTYTLSLSLFDLKNVGKTTEMLRVSMIIGLLLFIIASSL